MIYDTGFSFSTSSADHSGTISQTIGGADTVSTFANGLVTTGANPLVDYPTDTGDGVAIPYLIASKTGIATNRAGNDIQINLVNPSATDTYHVVLVVDYVNHVYTWGPNAYVHSEFTIDQDGSEIFFSDIESDVVYGDKLNGVQKASFGGNIIDSGQSLMEISIAPGATVIIYGEYTTKAESLDTSSGANGYFSGSVTVFFAGIEDADSDLDGATDYEEAIAGTSSSDSNDVFRVYIDQQDPDMILTWPSKPDRVYSVFARPDLLSGTWYPIATDIPATPPMNTYIVDEPFKFFYLTVEFPVH